MLSDDNTTTNLKTWKFLLLHYLSKSFSRCISHGLHLELKNIFDVLQTEDPTTGEMAWPELYPFGTLNKFAGACKDVVIYFYNHHIARAQLKKVIGVCCLPSIVSFSGTQWGSLLGCFRF